MNCSDLSMPSCLLAVLCCVGAVVDLSLICAFTRMRELLNVRGGVTMNGGGGGAMQTTCHARHARGGGGGMCFNRPQQKASVQLRMGSVQQRATWQ